jgi:trk system potassium uptake protein TrkH
MAVAAGAWFIAVGIGSIPIYAIVNQVPGVSMPVVDAIFDAMSGFTTTGMAIIPTHDLPHSLLFWRVFMQWIGGLGILTFFVMVLAESGGVASKLVATEANKTESGVIRPSLFNAIKSMWYVYVVLTVVQALLLTYFDVPPFHAVGHAMATLPTGGFSTTGDFVGMMGPGALAVFTVFMFVGGVNFLLLYSLFKGNIRRMIADYEFRIYLGATVTVAGIVALSMLGTADAGMLDASTAALFHTASIISSAGFTTMSLAEFPTFAVALFSIVMFVGGSLGSTTGGVKMLRFGIMTQVVRHHIRSITLPPTVMNPITVKGRILEDREVIEVASFFFIWLAVIGLGGLITIWFAPFGIAESMQLMVSAVGTMGPTIITKAQLQALPAVVKLAVALASLAGRLEMLPLLVLLNISIGKRFRR